MNTHFLKLNISFLFLIAIFFVPGMALADAQDFDEVTYVFRSFESDVPVDIQECFDMDIPFVTTNAADYDLYSFHSKKTNGRILTENIKKIGHVLTCLDWSGIIAWENRFDPIPAFFKVTLDGMELILQGQLQFLSFDVPEELLGLSTATLQVVEGPPDVIGGWLVSNTITNLFGLPGYANGSYASIRLFTLADNSDGE
jgi:hypothetical protein